MLLMSPYSVFSAPAKSNHYMCMTDQVMFGGRSRAQRGFPAASVRRTPVAYLGWPPRRACVTLTDTASRTAPHGPATHSGQG
jgi:hypothetical protein